MKEEKYLPLGSVILLKGAKHCISIMGYCIVVPEQNNRQYDYVGVPYPEGYMGLNSIIYFNHSSIEKIVNVGFSNDEDKKFKENLKKAVQMISKNGDTNYVDDKYADKFFKSGAKNE